MNARLPSDGRWIAAVVLSLCAWCTPGVGWAHDGHGQLPMWQACERATVGESCRFENAAHDRYFGSCRLISDDLVCVRNRPIERASTLPQPPASLCAHVAFPALILVLLGAFVRNRRTDTKPRTEGDEPHQWTERQDHESVAPSDRRP